jgi:hypothetical protein
VPKVLQRKGNDICKDGDPRDYGTPSHWKQYFDVQLEANWTSIKSMKMNFKWQDQGWGGQKGYMGLRLRRNGKTIAEWQSGKSPHRMTHQVTELDSSHAIVKEAKGGDTLEVRYNPGGGPGHRLTVQNFKIDIEYI